MRHAGEVTGVASSPVCRSSVFFRGADWRRLIRILFLKNYQRFGDISRSTLSRYRVISQLMKSVIQITPRQIIKRTG
jgi:hypothetical protein